MSVLDDKTLRWAAEQAYIDYGSVTGFKNYQGLPMPKWEDLPEKIQAAWLAATKRIEGIVLDVYGEDEPKY